MLDIEKQNAFLRKAIVVFCNPFPLRPAPSPDKAITAWGDDKDYQLEKKKKTVFSLILVLVCFIYYWCHAQKLPVF